MGKKIRFPLKLAEGAEVRTLEELREHFDLQAVLEYYKNGKLLTWLEDRYLEGEAEAVRALDESTLDFQRQLCELFQVEYMGDDIDLEVIERRQERLKRLRSITDDVEYIQNIDQVAFDQEELADLLDEGEEKIYLCGEHFTVPASRKGVSYIGINNPAVHISGKVPENAEELGIDFVGTICDVLPRNLSELNNTTESFISSLDELEILKKKLSIEKSVNDRIEESIVKDLIRSKRLQVIGQVGNVKDQKPICLHERHSDYSIKSNTRCCIGRHVLNETLPCLDHRFFPAIGEAFKLYLLKQSFGALGDEWYPEFTNPRDQLIANRMLYTRYETGYPADSDSLPVDLNDWEQIIVNKFLKRYLTSEELSVFEHIKEEAKDKFIAYSDYTFFAERAHWRGMPPDFYVYVREARASGWLPMSEPTKEEIKYCGEWMPGA